MSERNALAEKHPKPDDQKEPQDVPKSSESKPEVSDPAHPTGRLRYRQKGPPVNPSDAPAPAGAIDRPMESGDMEYTPSEPPQAGDVDMIDDQDLPVPPDPSEMPMDISQLVERLSEPPEMLYRRLWDWTDLSGICS